MMRTKRGATTVALGAVVALAAAACSSGGTTGSGASASGAAATKGGTIYILNVGPHNGLDPQASYVGADLEFANHAQQDDFRLIRCEQARHQAGGVATRQRVEHDIVAPPLSGDGGEDIRLHRVGAAPGRHPAMIDQAAARNREDEGPEPLIRPAERGQRTGDGEPHLAGQILPRFAGSGIEETQELRMHDRKQAHRRRFRAPLCCGE